MRHRNWRSRPPKTAQTEIDTLKHPALEQGSAAVEEIKTAAQSAARQAQEAGRDFVHEQKENLAHKVDEYAGAVRATADCREATQRRGQRAWPSE